MNNVTKELKLQTLISESKDWAVLGISYSTMVCDNQCLETYLSSLRDFQHLHIIKASSIPTFTFKASKTFHRWSVWHSCWNVCQSADKTINVIAYISFILMSYNSMKKVKMAWTFDNNTIQIGKKKIKLMKSTSSHYILQLSLWRGQEFIILFAWLQR